MRRAESALGEQSAAGAPKDDAGPGVVCDRAGAVEPSEPTVGVGQTGGQAQRPASRGAHEPSERVRTERTPPGTGWPGLADLAARVLSGAGQPQQMAQGVLPPRRLRVNRREVKQLYNNYQPKKRHLPRLSRLSRRSSFSTLSCCSTRSLLSPRQREEPQV